MKRSFIIILAAVFALSFLLAGCAPFGKIADKWQEDKKVIVEKPGDYFPLVQGSTWSYLGDGNEYASFNRKVLFTKGNRAQIREDNGGTVVAMVFEVTDEAVTRIFYQGEVYNPKNLLDLQPNENIIILKAPIEVGTKWKESNYEKEIIDINASVDTPLGVYQNCVQIRISGEHSTLYEYYKSGVGLVKREFISEDTRVNSILKAVSFSS